MKIYRPDAAYLFRYIVLERKDSFACNIILTMLSKVIFLITTVRGAKMQMWTRIVSGDLNVLLRYGRYPNRPDITVNIPELKSPVNMDNNYGLRLTTYYKVENMSSYITFLRHSCAKTVLRACC